MQIEILIHCEQLKSDMLKRWYLGVSNNKGPNMDPKIVGLLIKGLPKRGP